MLKVLEITNLEQFLVKICREKNDNKIKVSNGSPEKRIFRNYCVWKKVIQGTVFAIHSWFSAYNILITLFTIATYRNFDWSNIYIYIGL